MASACTSCPIMMTRPMRPVIAVRLMDARTFAAQMSALAFLPPHVSPI